MKHTEPTVSRRASMFVNCAIADGAKTPEQIAECVERASNGEICLKTAQIVCYLRDRGSDVLETSDGKFRAVDA